MKRMLAVTTLALLILLSLTALAAPTSVDRFDQAIQQAVSQKMWETRQLQNVRSSAVGGIVTLTGTVNLYQDKLDAAGKVKKIANVKGVRNDISVAGKTVPDRELQKRLSRELAYDRVGYFAFYDNSFSDIEVAVKGGVVTLSGDVYWEPLLDAAMSIAAHTPGVKGVVNNVRVIANLE